MTRDAKTGVLARRKVLALMAATALPGAIGRTAAAADLPAVRLGMLRFGSAEWEYRIAHQHRFDTAAGVAIEPVEFAAGDAAQTALLAGRVDVILQDWLWVSRQRDAGADYAFRPLSSSLGAVLAPQGSAIASIADLKGKRLGVAGTPLDKSWVLLRVYARARWGLDLDRDTDHSFGPPPLLAKQMQAGHLDAVLTFWPFAARAEAEGAKIVITLDQVLDELGFTTPVPFVGYVFSTGWAAKNAEAWQRFLAATDRARKLLDRDDAVWASLRDVTGAPDPVHLAALRRWYRAGHPGAWTSKDVAAANRVYELLGSIGGPALLGPSKHIAEGTFWLGPA